MKKVIELSIVIPTLNEEHYIGTLLSSIFNQTVCPEQIFIIDAFSKDQTRQVVKNYQKKLPQLQFYQIPKYSISRQRNFGVTKSKSTHILFLDADMELRNSDTLEKYFSKVKRDSPDIAAAINHPDTQYWKDKIYFKSMEFTWWVLKPFWPIVTTMNLYIKKEPFLKIGGFDEEIKVGEDIELVQRMVRKGYRFAIFRQPKMYTSARRIASEGRVRFITKMLRSWAQVSKHGFRDLHIEYEFGNHRPFV